MPVGMMRIWQLCLGQQECSLRGRFYAWSGKINFQPGEETARGAEIAIEDGYVENVDAIFGLHIGTLFGKEIPCGKFIISSGCCMALMIILLLK